MSGVRYALAPQGVFRTVQGEGALSGLPSVFVRLAGCSVGCAGCDTDYTVRERVTPEEVAERARPLVYGGLAWAWVTGGEPADQGDLLPLVAALRGCGLKVALATAGVTESVPLGRAHGGFDFVSVSPHDPRRWRLRRGDQLNLVPGLGPLRLSDPELLDALDRCERHFSHRYVTPLAERTGSLTGLKECLSFVQARAGWRLGVQAHKAWGLP